MGFSVVRGGIPKPMWVQIVDSDTLYVGQLVYTNAEGVAPLSTAGGAYDTTNKKVPFGIVAGTNLATPLFSSSYSADYITDVTPLASTTDYRGIEGVWSKGDKVAMVEVIRINPETVIRGPLYNSSFGTAPTVVTVTTGSAAGTSATVGAVDVAGVANLSSLYFRSGANAGAYRVTDDTSTTAITWDKPTTNAVAVGDTMVRVNIRPTGLSRVQFDSESMFVDISAAVTTDYYGINVLKLDLSEAGKEHVEFTFNIDHFAAARA